MLPFAMIHCGSKWIGWARTAMADNSGKYEAPVCRYNGFIQTYFHFKVVKGVFIDIFHLVHHPHGVVGHRANVRAPSLVVCGVIETRSCHVSGADCLYLLQLPELVLADDLSRAGKSEVDTIPMSQ